MTMTITSNYSKQIVVIFKSIFVLGLIPCRQWSIVERRICTNKTHFNATTRHRYIVIVVEPTCGFSILATVSIISKLNKFSSYKLKSFTIR